MLALIKTLHAFVYAAVAVAIFYVLYSGVTGTLTAWTAVAIALVVAECLVFVANGFHCPLTQLAIKHGAPKGYVGESFLPERLSSRIFQVLGVLFVTGLALVLLRVF